MSEIELRSNEYNCKNCGSILHFDPNSHGLLCEKCKSSFDLDYSKTFVRHKFDKDAVESQKRNEWVEDNKVFKCKNCGASIVANKYEFSNTCPYCNTNIAVDASTLPGLKPDAIIPFAFDKTGASQKFVENVRKKFYVNGKFKRHLPENKIKGTYVPSFVYDMKTKSTYDGTLSKTEHVNGQSFPQTFYIKGNFDKQYNNIMIESSSKITQPELNGILPYDMSKAVDYKNGFILGYTVEHYAQTLKTCEEIAKQTVSKLIRRDILSKYSYDKVEEFNVKTIYEQEDFNYILVPIYKFEYTFKNKPFKTYMNGQNGKVDNNLPKSIPKIVMTVLIILLLIALPFILSLLGD